MGGICIDPGLGDRVVHVGPLRHQVGIALEFVLLKPGLKIRRHQLTRFGPALVLHDWSQQGGDAVAQQVV